VVCGLLISALAAAVVIARSERGRIDLVDELYRAELQSDWQLHQAFDVLPVEIGTDTREGILAIAPARIAWPLTPPHGARLRTAVGLLPQAWQGPGNGVNFRIAVEQDGRSADLFARYLDPVRVVDDRRWIPVDIDLSPFAGRPMTLVLSTEPSLPGVPPEAANDFAVWGAPRID
jgi:hypothetical protein